MYNKDVTILHHNIQHVIFIQNKKNKTKKQQAIKLGDKCIKYKKKSVKINKVIWSLDVGTVKYVKMEETNKSSNAYLIINEAISQACQGSTSNNFQMSVSHAQYFFI